MDGLCLLKKNDSKNDNSGTKFCSKALMNIGKKCELGNFQENLRKFVAGDKKTVKKNVVLEQTRAGKKNEKLASRV